MSTNGNPNMRVYHQDIGMKDVLESYVKGFKPPDGATLAQWDANYDPHTGRVWFRLTVEMPAPVEKNIITMSR